VNETRPTDVPELARDDESYRRWLATQVPAAPRSPPDRAQAAVVTPAASRAGLVRAAWWAGLVGRMPTVSPRTGPVPGGPGSGQGLAVARELAGVDGGTIRVDRSPLGGARFRVAWRAAEPAAIPSAR
jgi:hypothetical protein